MLILSSPATEQGVQVYRKSGFIRYQDFFSRQGIEQFRCPRVHRGQPRPHREWGQSREEYERAFNRLVNLWVDSPVAESFAFSERLVKIGRHLARTKRVRIYHNHAMVNPGG